jgi:hypothetical protein
MKPFDYHNPRWRMIFAYPVHSILENPPKGWLVGIGVGLLQWVIIHKAVWVAIAAAAVLGFIDQYVGERAARRRGDHNPVAADLGMYGKQIGLALVLGLWPFETLILAISGFDFHGMLPASAATWIAWHEWLSLHEKYVASGKPPIPIVSQVTSLLKRITSSFFPAGEDKP